MTFINQLREQGHALSHGWFWRNRSGAPVTVTLRTDGVYTAIKRVV